jgi:hypothetical protein
MRRDVKSKAEIGQLIAAEVGRLDHDVDEAALLLIRRSGQWMATLRRDGRRLDEACLAAIAEVSRKLSGIYDVEEAA